MTHENYGPQIDSTQLMIIAQTLKISVAHTSIYRFRKVKLSFSMGIRDQSLFKLEGGKGEIVFYPKLFPDPY